MTYEHFHSRGHAYRKIDGESDLAFTYGRAERVTAIDEGSGLDLRRAKRYNFYVIDPVRPPDAIFLDDFECGDLSARSAAVGTTLPVGGPSCKRTAATVEVEETYTYGGVGGRVSKRDTAITLDGNTGETFTQGWTYTELGDVASVTYPAGVVVTQAADPNGMARPASITATEGGDTDWETGTYSYDGAGNVSGIGDADFAYDKVGRLATGIVSTSRLSTGSLVQQDYDYDAFGNLQEIIGLPGRATPTSSATNRLTGAVTYRAAGNLTSWNGNGYEYDAFHTMITATEEGDTTGSTRQ